MKIHILDRQGPAFSLTDIGDSGEFLIGAAVCTGIIYVMSLFIWQIDIGNSKYTDELILQALAQ